jgi:hypothetical protein
LDFLLGQRYICEDVRGFPSGAGTCPNLYIRNDINYQNMRKGRELIQGRMELQEANEFRKPRKG